MAEPSGFLYPMTTADDGASRAGDMGDLLDDLAASATAKAVESATTTAASIADHESELAALAAGMADRIGAGGRVFTCGNGGSATDAEGVAALFREPPRGRPVPALSLVSDLAIVTALANDVGFERVFARQLRVHARPVDIVMGFSTSGNSDNVLQALRAGHDDGLLAVGFAGDRGGEMAVADFLDTCLVVSSTSIHRIQEAQSALAFDLWGRVQDLLERESANTVHDPGAA